MSKGPGDLSLAERLELAIKKLDFWYRISLIMVLIGLAALSSIISMSQFYFHDEIGKHGYIDQILDEETGTTHLAFVPYGEEIFPANGIVTLFHTQLWLLAGNGVVIGLLTFLFLWVSHRGTAHKKEFESIEDLGPWEW